MTRIVFPKALSDLLRWFSSNPRENLILGIILTADIHLLFSYLHLLHINFCSFLFCCSWFVHHIWTVWISLTQKAQFVTLQSILEMEETEKCHFHFRERLLWSYSEVTAGVWLKTFSVVFVHRWLRQQQPTGRRSPLTKTLIICSRSSSSATAALEKPPSCSATPTTPSRRPLSAQLALTSRWRLSTGMTRGLNYRSG